MSASSHASVIETKTQSALDELRRFIDEQRASVPAACDFDQFECELHQRIVEVEREILAEELARYDVDVPVVRIDGVERVIRALAYQAGRHPRRKKLRRELTYLNKAAPRQRREAIRRKSTTSRVRVCT